jgi:hypothetical protein
MLQLLSLILRASMLRGLSAKVCPTLRNVGAVLSRGSRYFDKFSLSQRHHRAPINPLGFEAGYQLLSTGISGCALPQYMFPRNTV